MNQSVAPATGPSAGRRVYQSVAQIPLIYYVLAIVLFIIYLRTPQFFQPNSLLAFIRSSAPLIIVSIGQMFVLLSGELDLSVGSLISVCAALASKFVNNQPEQVGFAMVVIFTVAAGVGLINGIVTTRFNVPSFVTTLAMWLVAQGVISIITGGAAQGGLTENFRIYGRGSIGDTAIPVALIIMIVLLGFSTILMRRTTFGRRVYAVGSNPLAARLSGVRVKSVKMICFVLCSVFACVSSILLVGFSGMGSLSIGSGYEFQSISAAVLGGVALTGGRGGVFATVAGALTLQAIFRLLNFLALPSDFRLTVQGLIILGAVALTSFRSRRT